MHIIQHRKSSIFRAVILVAMLEFIFVEKSCSNQKTCGDRNTGNISYFTLHSEVVNWTEAWRQCNNQSATLPVICNQHEQDAFTKYLRENTRNSPTWTSARRLTFGEWKWVDGQSFTSTEELALGPSEYFTRAYFDLSRNDYRPTGADPRHKCHYLCNYSDISGSSCMHGNEIQVKNGCIRPSTGNNNLSWFEARNQCVGDGGDLASLVDVDDLATLRNSSKLNTAHRYWIGLGNTTWRWMRHKAEPAHDSGEDVKYTNWGSNEPYASGECISINVSNGGWNSVSCTERKTTTVVCQISFGSDEITSRTSSSMTTSRPTSSSEEPSTKIYSGVGAGILILIICIIVIIFVVKYKRKPHRNVDQSKVMNSSELNGLQLYPNKPATSPANASAIAPVNPLVAGTDDTLGVYAEITREPLNQSEDEAQLQQPGVLYAALEFQKEPTYLEPGQKSYHASDQTKAGPMGDIYAIPDAKGRTGNEPASHPVIVTSQGEIYALPLKNSKSPTANSPVGGIYANL